MGGWCLLGRKGPCVSNARLREPKKEERPKRPTIGPKENLQSTETPVAQGAESATVEEKRVVQPQQALRQAQKVWGVQTQPEQAGRMMAEGSSVLEEAQKKKGEPKAQHAEGLPIVQKSVHRPQTTWQRHPSSSPWEEALSHHHCEGAQGAR